MAAGTALFYRKRWELIMPVKKVKGGYKVKYPGSKSVVKKTKAGAKLVQRKQKAKGAY